MKTMPAAQFKARCLRVMEDVRALRRATSSGGFGIAAITLWEIAMLFVRGRLRSKGTVETALGSCSAGLASSCAR